MAARTLRGVIGVSFTSAPILRSASRIAFAMAAGGEIAPPSPMPFMPYSVCGVGGAHVRDPDRRNLRRTRQQVVRKGGGERLAVLVVRNFFVERIADALRDAPDDL